MRHSGFNDTEERSTLIIQAIIVFSSAVAGLSAIIPMLKELPLLRSVPALYLVVFLPVTFVGGACLMFGGGFKRIPPALPLLSIILVGISWTEIQDISRAFLFFFSFVATISFGAALRTEYYWRLAARTFVIFSTLSSFVLITNYLNVRPPRLGLVYNAQGVRIIEPNIPGTLCAFAGLLAIILLLEHKGDSGMSVGRWGLLFCLAGLMSTLALTKSRGAFLSFAVALVALFVFGRARKLLGFYITCGLLLFAAPFLGPIIQSSIFERFTSANVGSYNGRTQIWKEAVDLMANAPLQMVFGAGTGSGPTSLGRQAPYLGDFLNVEDYSGYTGGTLRINSHSSYIEWWLTFGFIGALIGIVVVALLLARSWLVDRHMLLASGTALTVFFLMTSVSLVAYRIPGVSVACGALTVGYLYYNRGENETKSRKPIRRDRTSLTLTQHARKLTLQHFR